MSPCLSVHCPMCFCWAVLVGRSTTGVPDFWGGNNSRSGPRRGWLTERGLEFGAEVWAMRLGWHGGRGPVTGSADGWKMRQGFVGREAWYAVGDHQEACVSKVGQPGETGTWLVWLTLALGTWDTGPSCLMALSGVHQILSHVTCLTIKSGRRRGAGQGAGQVWGRRRGAGWGAGLGR